MSCILSVQILPSSTPIPYEDIDRLCLDVWSPCHQQVFHVSHDGSGLPFEAKGTSHQTPITKYNLEVCFKDFKNKRVRLCCGNEANKVMLMIRVYARQPHFDHDGIETMQHIGDICLLREDFVSSLTVTKQVKCYAEGRNLSIKDYSEINHPSLKFTAVGKVSSDKSIYDEIETNLRLIYNEVTTKEIDSAFDNNTNKYDLDVLQSIAPMFLSPTGVPFKPINMPGGNDYGYKRCKGFTVQSYWRTRDGIVSDKWILTRLEESLNTRNRTTKDIVDFFNKNKCRFTVHEEEFVHFLVDVLRISTIHASTRPYISDKKWKADNISYGIDDYNIGSVIPGDCEDGACLAVSILWCIIQQKWYRELIPTSITDDEVNLLQCISKLVRFAGIPFGANGSGNVASCGHSFGVLIPFHVFLSWLPDITNQQKDDLLKQYELSNGFTIESTKELKHVCVLETTVLTSTLYHDVKKDAMHIRRAELNKQIKQQLVKRHGENGLLWKNYHVQEPLSSKNTLECRVNRIFCPILLEYFGAYRGMYYKYNRTFTLFKAGTSTRGVYGPDFFGHGSVKIDAKVCVEITKQVYEADEFFSRNFDRPVVPLCLTEPGYDFFRFDDGKSLDVFNRLRVKYANTGVDRERINVFCWKLTSETESVVESLRFDKKRGVVFNKLSNGFCFGI